MKFYTRVRYPGYISYLDVVVNDNHVTFYYVTRLVLASSCLSLNIFLWLTYTRIICIMPLLCTENTSPLIHVIDFYMSIYLCLHI